MYPALHYEWRTMLMIAAAVESGGEMQQPHAHDAAARRLACRCLPRAWPGTKHGNLRLGCSAWDAANFSVGGVGTAASEDPGHVESWAGAHFFAIPARASS